MIISLKKKMLKKIGVVFLLFFIGIVLFLKPKGNYFDNNDIFLVKGDSKQIVSVNLSDPTKENLIWTSPNGTFLWKVKLSPDKSKLAYLRSNVENCYGQCGFEIGVINLSNGNSKKLFLLPVKNFSDTIVPSYSWLEDSSSLVYSIGAEIWKVNVLNDSSSLILKVNDLYSSKKLLIQSIGSDIYFSTKKSLNKFNIADPSKIDIVINTDKIYNNFVVSANAKDVVYGGNNAMLFNVEMNKTKDVGTYPCAGFYPIFSPDSNRFIIVSGCGDGGSAELFDSSGNVINAIPAKEIIDEFKLMGPGNIVFNPTGNYILLMPYSIQVKDGFKSTQYAFIVDSDGKKYNKINLSGTGISVKKSNINKIEW